MPSSSDALQHKITLVAERLSTGNAGDWRPGGRWEYLDADRTLVLIVVRFDRVDEPDKTFRPFTPDGNRWRIGDPPGPLPLYRLAALAGQERVFVTEGEKAADAAASIGLVATTNAHGANSVAKTNWGPLAGKGVVLLPDRDAAGRRWEADVRAGLAALDPPALVRVVELPDVPEHGDIVEFIESEESKGGEPSEIADKIRALGDQAPVLVESDCATDLATTADRSGEWEEPAPLAPTFAPPLPLDVLPEFLSRFVADVAESMRTPTDLPYVLGLATCSLAITRKLSVEVVPTWREPANIYVADISPTSEGKSPTFTLSQRPVLEWESQRRAECAVEIERQRLKLDVLRRRAAAAARAAADPEAGEAEMSSALESGAKLAACTVSPLPQLTADDASVEALDQLLCLHGGRMGVFSAEGTPFEIAAGRYSDRSNPDVFLKAWSGDRIRVNRVGREGGACDEPYLTCCVTTQPETLRRAGEVQALRRRGFLGRWLYAVPESRIGRRSARLARVSGGVVEEYGSRVRALLDLPWPEKPHVVPLADAASELFVAYRAALEPRLGPDGELASIADWAAKTDKQVLRLALILHVIDDIGRTPSLGDIASRPVSGETMKRAIQLIEAFIPHAVVAFSMTARDGGASDATYLLEKLRSVGKSRLSRREIRRSARKFDRDSEMAPALAKLIEHGYIRLLGSTSSRQGSPRTETYEVHPEVVRTQESRAKRAERVGDDGFPATDEGEAPGCVA